MAQHGTGDLSAPDAMECDASEERGSFDLRERLEEATHTAHTLACHLRLLVAACTTQRGPSFQLRSHSFATGMQGLSDCVSELEDQLDALPVLNDRHAGREIGKCSSIATRAAGLMRLIADTTSTPCLDELELDIEDFIGSLQDLADRIKKIEGCLECLQRRQGGRG